MSSSLYDYSASDEEFDMDKDEDIVFNCCIAQEQAVKAHWFRYRP
jgi:hypothetical protein